MKWSKSLVLFGLGLLLTVGCVQNNPTSSSGSPDRLVLGTTATLSTLDPADAGSTFASLLLYNLTDRLYTYKLGTNQIEPQLATAMPKVSADGLTYTIPLRQGVKFHDGTPFNAAAMVYSLNRLMQSKGTAPVTLSEVESVKASGEFELTIKLKEPFTAFPALLTYTGTGAISPKAYGEIKEGEFKPKEVVGTGPYKLTQYGTDVIRLEAFESYWGGKPSNQGVDVQLLSSGANLYNAFRTGAIDLALQGLAIEQIANLQKETPQRGWQMIERAGNGITILVPNLKSPPLDKLEVRQALAAIIDRNAYRDRVFAGQVEPLYSLLPNHMAGRTASFQTAYGDGQFDKAKALLQQAGFSAKNPAAIELWYRSNITNDQLAALTLKAQVDKHLGGLMQIKLDSVESTTAYGRLDKGVYPTFILDWSGDYFDADTYIYPFLECSKGDAQKHCEAGQSTSWGSFYFSDQANQLVAASRKEQDVNKRQQIIQQLQELNATDVAYIPLWQGKNYLFVQKGVQGASLEVTQKVPLWRIKK
jgi:peptide/nickel transport system substrate-binding protein